MEPKVITDTLRAIEDAERPADHPRILAREAVARWRSDASRQSLPIVNIIDSGAQPLRADDVLNHDHHQRRLGRK